MYLNKKYILLAKNLNNKFIYLIMKRLTLFLFIIFAFGLSNVYSQGSNVATARSIISNPQSPDLGKAKTAIDEAIEHEKTKDDYRTWEVRGDVYRLIFENPLPAIKELSDKPLLISFESYQKALELINAEDWRERKKERKKEDILKKIDPMLKNNFINSGALKFNSQEYEKALAAFEKSIKIYDMDLSDEPDTLLPDVYYNAAIAADLAKKREKAVKYYNKAAETGYESSDLYIYASNAYKAMKDTAKALEMIEKGLDRYPDSTALVGNLINTYIETNKIDKALEFINLVIERGQANATYYFTKGALYDAKAEEIREKQAQLLEKAKAKEEEADEFKKAAFRARFKKKESAELKEKEKQARKEAEKIQQQGQQYNDKIKKLVDKAFEAYQKSIEMDPDYPKPYYNLGKIYVDKSDAIIRKANTMPRKTDEEEAAYQEMIEKSNKILNKAIQYFEKAHELEPEDESTIRTLRSIYYKLREKEGMMEKYEEMNKKLKNL